MRLVQLTDSAGTEILVNAELVRMIYADGPQLTRVSFQPSHSILVKGTLADVAARISRSA